MGHHQAAEAARRDRQEEAVECLDGRVVGEVVGTLKVYGRNLDGVASLGCDLWCRVGAMAESEDGTG